MLSHLRSRGQNSSSPPPPYAEIDPALSTQSAGSRHTYGKIQVSGGAKDIFGDRILRPGQSIFDDDFFGDDEAGRAESTPRYNGRTVKFTKVEGGIEIEGSESASERAVVPEPLKKTIEFTDGLAIEVISHEDAQFARLISVDFSAFGLSFSRGNGDVSIRLETGSPTTLGSGAPRVEFDKFAVERQGNVVTVRYR